MPMDFGGMSWSSNPLPASRSSSGHWENGFYAQAAGQPELEVFAEATDKYFLEVVDARIEFYPEADGFVKGMKHFQGGEMEGNRIR